ncbi:MAG: ribosome maturation factor RimM [Synergistaceae bacterium]|jgi:16S rRNA processing protein RimM|nr:ribosome maturation factor RimM [Synergistaceae bacterium]
MSTSSKTDGCPAAAHNDSAAAETATGGEAELVAIGYVASAHGVKGAVKVVPLTDFPERFRGMETLNLYKNGAFIRSLRVLRVRDADGCFIIESDALDRDEAEKLAGTSILIDKKERAALPDGSFWIDDLIGLNVVETEGGLVLGTVEDFVSGAGQELYAVRGRDGRLRYIPAVAEFVDKIDLAAGVLSVRLIDGLW